MNLGIDVGYSATKAVSGNRRAAFPSVVGTPDRAKFSLNTDQAIVLVEPDHVQVGEEAVSQSRFLNRREDRRWTESNEWYTLAIAAFTELTTASVEFCIVTGLPVAFYTDKAAVRDRLLGKHKAQREGRHAQTFKVTNVRVIPQPFGALLAETLNNRGRIVDHDLATGNVGVMDIGGKTTNLLSVHHLSEISKETASVNIGAWDAVRAVRNWLTEHCPDLDLRDHQIIEAIIARSLHYYGESVDLSGIVAETLEPLSKQVLAEATQLWNGGASLNAILVSGGGALLLGNAIRQHFRHARVVSDPVFANALGYWRFAERLNSQ